MNMDSFAFLPQSQEDALHASRLLNVEEKLFRRITKRLLASNSLITTPQTRPSAPVSDATAADEDAAARESELEQLTQQCDQLKEEALLDFAAFESNIVRVQFLLDSNVRERERYSNEKSRILDAAHKVRGHNVRLHEQLKEAQKILAVRKSYDELADKITGNRMLKPRDDQHLQLQKLNNEIAELERESQEYAKTWAERREQFGKIVEEGMQMLRLIRDEKEEAERKEGMDMEHLAEREDGDFPKQGGSSAPTPRPTDEGATPLPDSQDTSDRPLEIKDRPSNRPSAAPSPDAQSLPADLDLESDMNVVRESFDRESDQRDGIEDEDDDDDDDEGVVVERMDTS